MVGGHLRRTHDGVQVLGFDLLCDAAILRVTEFRNPLGDRQYHHLLLLDLPLPAGGRTHLKKFIQPMLMSFQHAQAGDHGRAILPDPGLNL